MLRTSVRAPFHFLFRSEGYNRARRNVATLFEQTLGRTVTAIRIAERDRMVYLDLEDGLSFQFMLFGPRANIFLVEEDTILEAFQADADLTGTKAPVPQPAPHVDTLAEFEARWRSDRKTLEQTLTAALPLFDRTLASEVINRAGIAAGRASECTEADRKALFEAARSLRRDLEEPSPRVYWRGRFPDTFSLVRLHACVNLQEEAFDSVNDAVAVFVRKSLALEQFRRTYEPLEKALTSALDHYRTSTERMLEDLSRESRAERYEHWGHLLMASAAGAGSGSNQIILPDLFAENEPVIIPLDPARSAIDNAQAYYERARRTRQAHAHAEERLVQFEERARAAEALLTRLREIDSLTDLERFRSEESSRLGRLVGQEAGEADHVPFRRYRLEGDYEVWVGKNARQNDLLTFRYAQKHDLWMHARGISGSHVILRLPNRNARPGKVLLEKAASIAAYHSKAQGSGLVPVMVTERKYVRKPKGAPPGAVAVEREDVLIVEPRLPEQNA
jgi:predicted ribosome quality control (RQC) complex YloA/Tae2 family protein